MFFSPAVLTRPVSDVLVARQPLRGGVEHKLKGAAQLPDQLMTNVEVPVMSTIDYAFLFSPDLTLQKREQRHTCTKPSPPPLSIFSSLRSLIPEGGFCSLLLMTTYAHIYFLSVSHLLLSREHLLMPREKLIDKCFIFHLFHWLVLCPLLCFFFHSN